MNTRSDAGLLTLSDVRPFLHNVKTSNGQLVAACPICEGGGKGHHLYLKEEGGRLLAYCQKCNAKGPELFKAFRRLGAKPTKQREPEAMKPTKKEVIEEYDHIYREPDGSEAYRKTRTKYSDGSKIFTFKHRLPSGSMSFKKPEGCNNLYNLDLMAKALKEHSTDTIYIVEGEKCADAMVNAGILATTSNTGAQKNIKLSETDRKYLTAFPVRIVIPDNDDKGLEYAAAWGDARVLSLPDIWPTCPKKGDVADYLLNGGKPEKILNYKFPVPDKLDREFFESLDSYDMVDAAVLSAIYAIKDPAERSQVLALANLRAGELRVVRQFNSCWKAYLQSQVARNIVSDNMTRFPAQPFSLRSGEWQADVNGVKRLVAQQNADFRYETASPIPIMPVEVLCNVEDRTEKVRLAFFKEGAWETIIVPRSLIASNNKIIELADFGIEVNSDNSKHLVKYLADTVAMNPDILPRVKSISHLGWDKDHFVPYTEDVKMDCEEQFKSIVNAMTEKGTVEEWAALVAPLRKNLYLRMIMAASFASPLISKVGALPFVLHLWGGTGSGKAQPLDTRIITPDGYKMMGDIKVGDQVIGDDGEAHTVTGVYPQGVKEIYELTFGDGRKTRCCKEHLWNVTTHTRRNHKRSYVTMELQEMLQRPIKKNKGYTYQIPLTKPVEFNSARALPVHPYLLGALIGDGCLTLRLNPANGGRCISWNNSDADVIERVKALLQERGAYMWRNVHTTNQFVIRKCDWLKRAIVDLSLNVKSGERFIPPAYKTAALADRVALLQGLLDTDGCTASGRITYSTTSRQLAQDVQELARSLGCRAGVSSYTRKGTEEYTVSISASGHVQLFKARKHATRFTTAKAGINRSVTPDSLAIIDVKPCGKAECQCIMVDSTAHTYLCDDYIVTHNTVGMMVAASVWGNPNFGAMLRTMNMTVNSMMATAAVLKHVPFFGDELQTIKTRYDNYDTLIMRVCEGVDRGRMTNTILQKQATWANSFIFTGEEPCTQSVSGGGVQNRVIEIECDEQVVAQGNVVVNRLGKQYGTAGSVYIEALRKEKDLRDLYQYIFGEILNNTRTTEKQAMSMGLMLLGDMIARQLFWPDEEVLTVAAVQPFLKDITEVDVAERAFQVLRDLIAENATKFDTDFKESLSHVTWGTRKPGYILFNKTVLERELAAMGFSWNAVKKKWAAKGYIELTNQGRYVFKDSINGVSSWYVHVLEM